MMDLNFNGLFGKVAPGMCRLTMNGGVAVKCSGNKFKTYNVKKKTLTNVTNFCFNAGDDFFFVLPTNKVGVGDIILVEGKPKCVLSTDASTITVIDYENSEVRTIVPERHMFLGRTYFYGKIVSLFGSAFKEGKGMNNIMKMMMMSSMFGGNNGGKMGGLDMGGGMGQMMMMSMFMGGKDNPFEDMFNDLSFETTALGVDDDDDDDEATEGKEA